MTKYFQRGKFNNLYDLFKKFNANESTFCSRTKIEVVKNTMLRRVLFTKIVIMRGIGYRIFALKNSFAKNKGYTNNFLYSLRPLATDAIFWKTENSSFKMFQDAAPETSSLHETSLIGFSEINKKYYDTINFIFNYDFPYSGYLLARAGHTKDRALPLISIKNSLGLKKDRKLVMSSPDKRVLSTTVKQLWLHRPPSVYTGRGVRIKHVKVVRKAGKKSKQKGKTF